MPRQVLGVWVNIACSWVIWAASSLYAKERFAPFLPHRLGCARMDPFSCLFCCWLSMIAHDFQVLQVGWSHPQLYTQSRWNSLAWKGPPGNSAFDVPFFLGVMLFLPWPPFNLHYNDLQWSLQVHPCSPLFSAMYPPFIPFCPAVNGLV